MNRVFFILLPLLCSALLPHEHNKPYSSRNPSLVPRQIGATMQTRSYQCRVYGVPRQIRCIFGGDSFDADKGEVYLSKMSYHRNTNANVHSTTKRTRHKYSANAKGTCTLQSLQKVQRRIHYSLKSRLLDHSLYFDDSTS